MKSIFQKFWKSLRSSFIRPFLRDLIIGIKRVLGIQHLNQAIGKARVPYLNRYLLKKSFSQQGEDLILDRIITRVLRDDIFDRKTYVDIGAYDAIDHSVTYLLYLRGWSGIVFDPSVSTRRSFERWRKNDIFVNAVVGEVDRIDVEFFIHKTAVGDKSLISTKYPGAENAEDYDKVTCRQVNLNSELKRQGVEKVGVLNIDVEGAEFEILQSFDFEYFRPSIISVEIHGNDLEKCLRTDIAQHILGKGYQFSGSAVITQFFVRTAELAKG